MYRIVTPMSYSTSAGDNGVFDKRTGTNKIVTINIDNISVSPVFEKVGQFVERLLIRVKVRSLKGAKFTIPDKYYVFSNKVSVSGFAPNVDFLLQIRLIEVKSLNDKVLALAGQRPKIQRTGSLNQFKFKYFVEVDLPENSNPSLADSSADLLDLPRSFGSVVKPRDSVF